MFRSKRVVASALVAFSVLTSGLTASAAEHTVQTGETLESISTQYGVPTQSVQALNNLTDTSTLAENQTLLVPERYYATSGQTLTEIAGKHDYTVDQLLKLNPQLTATSYIRNGEKIYVPWRNATVTYGVNFRTAPSTTGSQVLFLVPTGATVYVLHDVDDSWAKVRYIKSGVTYTGYISKKYFKVNDGYTAPAVPAWEQQADSIIAEGMKYLGAPYVLGAPSYYVDGTFDCSSFTQYMYYLNGIKLPRDSRQQSVLGTPVDTADLRKGDLMFFTTSARSSLTGTDRVGHVGIYMGDGKILHTYKTGVGVVVSSFKYYWMDNYLFSKRIIAD